jgi:multicomponent Na+:H+ antiporter subunit D
VGLYEVSGDKKDYRSLRGAGYRNPMAGIGFTVGAFSMVGFPMLSGFISKLLFASSALQSPHKMLPTLIALAISTVLNAIYFLRLVITLYSRRDPHAAGSEVSSAVMTSSWKLRFAIICFIILNLVLGLCSQPIVSAIGTGLTMFG